MPNTTRAGSRGARRLALTAAAVAALSGCAELEHAMSPPPPTPACAAASAAAGWRAPWVRAADGRIGFGAFMHRMLDARVVLVGEAHDRFDHHLTQLEVICRLHTLDIDLAIGMEFFQQPFQKPLDEFVTGRRDAESMLLATEYFSRWRYDYRLYAPLLEFAREHAIPVVALNVAGAITRKVARGGRASLESAELAGLPAADLPVGDDYRARIREIFDQHPEIAGGDFEHFLEAQLLWDEGMAARAAEYLAAHPGRRLVVLAGAGHVSPDAIPRRIERRTGIRPVVVQPAEAPRMAGVDYTVETAPIPLRASGRLGVYLSGDGDGLVIEDFAEGSGARAAGIVAGERIVAVEGRPATDIAEVKVVLWRHVAGEVVAVRVQGADGGEREVEVRLQ